MELSNNKYSSFSWSKSIKRINSIIKKRHFVGKTYYNFLKEIKIFIYLSQKKILKKYILGSSSSNN